jgi:hypothetical protein
MTAPPPMVEKRMVLLKVVARGSIWGNVILGGGIGAIVDADKDMHRIYPDSYVIPVVKN